MDYFKNGPLEPWVVEHKYNDFCNADDMYSILLHETQVHYRHGQLSIFNRCIICIRKIEDLQAIHPLQITLNETNDVCTFNAFKLLRNSTETDRTETIQFTELQRETELNNNIYTGLKTVIANVEGIQVNDIIDYSFTITTQRLNCKEHFSYCGQTVFTIPVYRQYLSVDYDNNGRSCAIRIVHSFDKSQTAVLQSGKRYEYNNMNIAPLEMDSYIPPEENPFSFIEFSDYSDWKELGADLLGAYRQQDRDESIAGSLATIISKDDPIEAKIEKIINHIKTKIGYLSLSLNEYTFAPHLPSETLKKNFGDCKDKSLLLKTMLEMIGVPASVLLVNTNERANICRHLISPSLFDHAIVSFIHNETTYYVDPADSYQLFTFSTPVEHDYGFALDTTRSELIPFHDVKNDIYKRAVQETFTISGDEAELHVEDAFSLRSFASEYARTQHQSIDEIEKLYLEKYKAQYQSIELGKEKLHFEIDIPTQKITYFMQFHIDNLWGKNEDDMNKLQVLFIPKALFDESFILHQEAERKQNAYWPHPVEFNYSIDIHTDFAANFSDLSESTDSLLFLYKITNTIESKHFVFNAFYKSKVAILPKESFNEQVAIVNDLYNNGFFLQKNKPEAITYTKKKNKKSNILWIIFVVIIILQVLSHLHDLY